MEQNALTRTIQPYVHSGGGTSRDWWDEETDQFKTEWLLHGWCSLDTCQEGMENEDDQ